MSRASNALRDETERTRPYRYTLVVGASTYDTPGLYEALHPRCGCGCGRKLRGEVEVIDRTTYLPGHAARVTGDRQ